MLRNVFLSLVLVTSFSFAADSGETVSGVKVDKNGVQWKLLPSGKMSKSEADTACSKLNSDLSRGWMLPGTDVVKESDIRFTGVSFWVGEEEGTPNYQWGFIALNGGIDGFKESCSAAFCHAYAAVPARVVCVR